MTSNKAMRQYELVLGPTRAAQKTNRNENFWVYAEESTRNHKAEITGLFIKREVLGSNPPQRLNITLDWEEGRDWNRPVPFLTREEIAAKRQEYADKLARARKARAEADK